jgi:RimJ/RimL family protein N-acetyltransferase
VGWALSRQFWGRGLATEAARAAVAYAFERLGWDRLICVILPGNRRSIAVAQRLGARLDHVAEIHGLPHDIYEIVKAS